MNATYVPVGKSRNFIETKPAAMHRGTQIKFTLINPTSPLWRIGVHQRPANSGVFRFSMLASLYVAASMPLYVETKIVDEDVEPVDFDDDADIIGISFMTYNAPRAYEIADRFRAKGKTVIFGGYHPTFMPDEAIQHADAVCIGEAESSVPRMMEDYMNGRLKPFYRSQLVDLAGLPVPDRNLLRQRAYITTNTLQATRGCFNRCGFCSVARFNHYRLRIRPVGEVVEELKGLGREVLFMDDNIALDKEYARELFKAMIPLKKQWHSQCGIGIAEDEELLRLAAQSGCRGLFIGFESLSRQSLENWKKFGNKRVDYLEAVKKLHGAGIGVFAGFIFGSDNDGPDVFADTLDFLLEANIEVLQATRLTPFPGTPLYEQLDREGRIFDRDWSHYDFFHVVHQPLNMSVRELHNGTVWVQQQFYRTDRIIRRVGRASGYLHPGTVVRALLPLNLGYRHKLAAYESLQKKLSVQPKAG